MPNPVNNTTALHAEDRHRPSTLTCLRYHLALLLQLLACLSRSYLLSRTSLSRTDLTLGLREENLLGISMDDLDRLWQRKMDLLWFLSAWVEMVEAHRSHARTYEGYQQDLMILGMTAVILQHRVEVVTLVVFSQYPRRLQRRGSHTCVGARLRFIRRTSQEQCPAGCAAGICQASPSSTGQDRRRGEEVCCCRCRTQRSRSDGVDDQEPRWFLFSTCRIRSAGNISSQGVETLYCIYTDGMAKASKSTS
jgi:hypothetical protein